MTITRMLLGAVAAGVLAGSAAGQTADQIREGGGLPAPPAPAGTRFAKATAGEQPAVLPPPPGTATNVLGAPPGPLGPPAEHPPGTVTSPWCGDGLGGCCGPIGGNGPITYELYTRTGPAIVFGSDLAGLVNTGWGVSGGARTLFFNTAGDAAWALDTGIGYTYNRGKVDRFENVFTRQPLGANNLPLGPDQLQPHRLRGLHRTTFNLAIGRDWFLNGPGFLPAMQASNWRYGVDFGGRWGTGHVDLVPQAIPNGYTRRGGKTYSLFGALHADWEVPVGAWIFFAGGRVEYDYTWTNLFPPLDGNIQGVNLLLQAGVRF